MKNIEEDRLPLKGLSIFLVCVTLFVIIVGVVSRQALMYFSDAQTRAVDLEAPNSEINELKAQYQEELTTYGVIDEAKGIYRIPVRQSMEELARQGGVR